jgi:hypothetical protein
VNKTKPTDLVPDYAELAKHRTHEIEIWGWYDETEVIFCNTCGTKIIELNNPNEEVWT